MSDWKTWPGLAVATAVALAAALVIIVLTSVVTRVAARRREWPKALRSSARYPYRLLLLIGAAWIAIAITLPDPSLRATVNHAFLIAMIAVGTWFVAAIVSFVIGLAVGRYRTDVPDNRIARRLQTQLIIVRRLAGVVITIVGIASILLTFPGVQAVGASVLASAGLVSIVAGLAAQSTLANVFAGVQLAFSDAIRVDDVVIAEGQWGRIEEITLTYVVVHIWDDRRLVLPSTYFTSTPFENWTRHSSELLGSVEFDLDWRVSPDQMRTQLDAILADTDLWDGRTAVLQVTDAVGGFVRIRVLVTAVDAPTLFDLRCLVRERMVEWLHTRDAAALPRTRLQTVEQEARPRAAATPTEPIGLFTGTAEAEERASHFTSAIPVMDNPAVDSPAVDRDER
ncbi:mechanosensitive ion channel family protein [Lacisediminihabitans profunda]|uniref:Mechanosensitive ion channel family protein n=1 Tax=Lacisediminihabitans profunda TaxID=2594790 RepID=A0A5C8USH5_9MICO|nr:mechanosensitive ion channel family protein [Lacisediminihabitans profunda]TXN30483.1 mechanosensitive ion channel family protein [Lacisediminihabitans profunda]